MDKISEKVLKYCVRQSTNDLYTPIPVSADDFKLSYSQLNSVGDNLVKQGYLTDFEFASEETKTGKAYLSHLGYVYFRQSVKANLKSTVAIIISVLSALSSFRNELILLWKELVQLLK